MLVKFVFLRWRLLSSLAANKRLLTQRRQAFSAKRGFGSIDDDTDGHQQACQLHHFAQGTNRYARPKSPKASVIAHAGQAAILPSMRPNLDD